MLSLVVYAAHKNGKVWHNAHNKAFRLLQLLIPKLNSKYPNTYLFSLTNCLARGEI